MRSALFDGTASRVGDSRLPLPIKYPLDERLRLAKNSPLISSLRTGLGAMAIIGLLAACASPNPDAGFSQVTQGVKPHLSAELRWARGDGDRRQIDAKVKELLASKLTADAAVQVALLNHRGLQAAFDELDVAEADRVRALSFPNPGVGIARSRRGEEVEIETSLHFNIARLLALPLTRQVESSRLAQLQTDLALQAVTLASDTRKAWIQAVAAAETVRYAQQVTEAAQASAELARRMAAVGNFNRLQHAREQAFQADAALGLARAEQLQRVSRERLTRLMGLWGEQLTYSLPERLPDPPNTLPERSDLESIAIAQRLDVQAARLYAERTARSLGLTRATRFVNVLELGVKRETSNEASDRRSWEIGFELPIFDSGEARLARAEAIYRQALNRASDTAITARSEVREAYFTARSSWEVARYHRLQIVPLRQRIAEENLLRYNGMLIGVFELLADARAQITSVNSAIEAARDYWLAQADLDMALVGRPAMLGARAAAPVLAPASLATPHAGGH